MKRLLYIDIPFAGIQDGGANRSKFLLRSLSRYFEVDWLEICKPSSETGELPSGLQNHYRIQTETEKRFWQPQAINRFSNIELEKFREILKKGNYFAVFYRFLSPVRLGEIVREYDKDIIQVVDVDMLMSRLNQLSWQQNKSIKNRYYFLESHKLEYFEKQIMKKPYLFMLTNKEECEFIKQQYGYENIDVLPNVMTAREELDIDKENRILFFGTLTSAANSDALNFIADEIYVKLEPILEKYDMYLDIAGRGWRDSFKNIFTPRKRIRYLGEVDDINEEIAKSSLIFLPLRVASGTRTRILEAANQSAAVVTTTIGVEGLDLGDNELVIQDNAEELAKAVDDLLGNEIKRENMGKHLQERSRALYLEENVGERLYEMILKQGK